ncbi:MAG: hypothetical protein D6711_06695 [Chloroflexi bacterium]|nr:MAG: hypothetical protein D6711_06695 [Chloroflexota bacterium]
MSDDFEKDWLNNNDDDDDLDWLNTDEDNLPSTGELDLELDWMRDTETDNASQQDQNRLGVTGQLDWLRATQNQDQDDDITIDDDDDFTPAWLKEANMDTGEIANIAEQDLPDWLQQDDDLPDDQPEDDDIPDWLKAAEPQVEDDISLEDEASTWQAATDWEPQDTDDAALEDEEIPDWLKDTEPPTPLTTAEVMAVSSGQADNTEGNVDDIPDWLLAADEASDEEEEIPDVPEWLAATTEDDWQPAEDDSDLVTEDEALPEIPDWLRPEALEQEEQAIQTEKDAAFDTLFGDDLEPIEAEEDLEAILSEATAPNLDDLFDDTDFEAEVQSEEEDFDLLGDLASQRSGLTGLLGESDELAFLDDASDNFDLLGELAGDEDEFTDTPIADAVAEDEEFLSMAAEQSQKPLQGSIEDDTLHGVQPEDSEDFDTLLDDDPFRWFDEEQPASVSTSVDEDSLDWLQEIDEETLAQEAQQQASEQSQQPAASLDDYLATLDDNTFQLPQTGELSALGGEVDFDALLDDELFDPVTASTEEKPPIPQTPDMPEWLADLSSQTTGEKSAAAIVRKRKDRPLDDLDDRLRQLRERGMEVVTAETSTEDPDLARILPGIKQALPEITFEPTEATVIAPSLQLTMDQRRRADLLKELVGAEDNKQAEKSKKRNRLPLIERALLTVILLLLVAIPFFTDAFNIGESPSRQFAPGSREMAVFDQVDALQPGDYVLIAADYGASGAAELDTSTEAILRHALLRGAHPVIVSGSPIGLLRARVLIKTIAEESNLTINQDYTIGNYLVADVVGLRNFGENIQRYIQTDVNGEPTQLNIRSLDDFALLVVVVESADRLRGWVEQVAPITDARMVAVTGFSAEPLSEPYLSAESLSGYLVGYVDGYTYSVMLNTLISGGSLIASSTPTTPAPTATSRPSDTPQPTATTQDETAVNTVDMTPSDTSPSPTPQGGEAQIAATSTPTTTASVTPSPQPSETPTPTNSSTPTVRQIAIIAVEGAVNVRAIPSTSGDVVSALRTNNRADIIGQTQNDIGELWYNIRFIDPFSGQVSEGWVREDLIQVSLAGDELTPVPSPTPVEPIIEPSPTQEGASLKVSPVLKLQGGDEPTPTPEGEATPEVTPELTPELTAEQTPELTEEAPPTVPAPTVTPVVTGTEVAAQAQAIQPMDIEQRDARWYSMTLGLIGAILIITGGSILNILRVLRRRT